MRIRLIPPVETWPTAVRFVEGPIGKLALLVVFGLELRLADRPWKEITLVLAALSFFPQRRGYLVLAGTAWMALAHSPVDWSVVRVPFEQQGLESVLPWTGLQAIVCAVALAIGALYYAAAHAWPKRGPLARPVATLLAGYVGLMAAAAYLPLPDVARAVLWALVVVGGQYLWFLAYSLQDRQSRAAEPWGLQLRNYVPFWGSSATPFPKGAAYLRKIEAKDPNALAIAQLKGLKLLTWVLVLMAVNAGFVALTRGEGTVAGWLAANAGSFPGLGIPTLPAAMQLHLSGAPLPASLAWASLLVAFLQSLLEISIWGGTIIATCRVAGYNALRNTYRPLSATSIAEFWNRYYYYFKELLVDFFFYPAFLRYFKGSPRARKFFATLCAAGFGNFLYHFLRDVDWIVRLGPWDALLAFRVYAFYALVLGVAVGVSQLRTRRRANVGPLRQSLASFAIVAFYCVLHVFDEPERSLSFGDHCSFLLRLIGVGGSA